MKKEELTALGITDEQAAKVLEMHGKEQNEAASKLSEAENKLAAAEKNAKELTEKVKAFDGVDVAALKRPPRTGRPSTMRTSQRQRWIMRSRWHSQERVQRTLVLPDTSSTGCYAAGRGSCRAFPSGYSAQIPEREKFHAGASS